MLYLIPTPIGNLQDITLRALEVLKSVDGIICEDSRRTSILLNHYQIKKPFFILNDYNETKVYLSLLNRLLTGENLALVSDAGAPLIGDPGYKLVRECFRQGIAVDCLPGATSITTALSLSALPPQKFAFLHYLPEKEKARKNLLQTLQTIKELISLTYIVFVAPHKLITTLMNIQEILGNIEIVLAKELTKKNQSVEKKFVLDWLKQFQKQIPKGEYTMLFNLLPKEAN